MPHTEGPRLAAELESGAVLRSRSVAYCPHCDGPLFKGKHVAVVGGGNSGVEAAIDLAGIAAQVTLLEFDDKLRADAVLQSRLASLDNVHVVVGAFDHLIRVPLPQATVRATIAA